MHLVNNKVRLTYLEYLQIYAYANYEKDNIDLKEQGTEGSNEFITGTGYNFSFFGVGSAQTL